MTKFFYACNYLWDVLATLKKEIRILVQAVVYKKADLPPRYWRREVLRPVFYPEEVPASLNNYFCPLFWLSNIFPILWVVVGALRLGMFVWAKFDDLKDVISTKIDQLKFNRLVATKEWANKTANEFLIEFNAAQTSHAIRNPDVEFDWKTTECLYDYHIKKARAICYESLEWEYPHDGVIAEYIAFFKQFGDEENFLEMLKPMAKEYEEACDKKRKESCKKTQELYNILYHTTYGSMDEDTPTPKPVKKKFNTAAWTNMSKTFFKWFFIVVPSLAAIIGSFYIVPLVPSAFIWTLEVVFAILGFVFSINFLFALLFVAVIFGVVTLLIKGLDMWAGMSSYEREKTIIYKVCSFPLKVLFLVCKPFIAIGSFLVAFIKMTYNDNCPRIEWEEDKDEDEDKK